MATEIVNKNFDLIKGSTEFELFNKATNGVSISSIGVKINSGDEIIKDSLWTLELQTNCDGLNIKENNIKTASEVCFDNIDTNFSNDTIATIKIISESSLTDFSGSCSVKLDI